MVDQHDILLAYSFAEHCEGLETSPQYNGGSSKKILFSLHRAQLYAVDVLEAGL